MNGLKNKGTSKSQKGRREGRTTRGKRSMCSGREREREGQVVKTKQGRKVYKMRWGKDLGMQ